MIEARPAVAQTVPLEHAASETLAHPAPEPAEPESPPAVPDLGEVAEPVLAESAEVAPAVAEIGVDAPSRAEPVAGPISAPVIIGSDETAATEKKRGWWRR